MTDALKIESTSKQLDGSAGYQRKVASKALVDKDFPFESDKQFDDGRGNNFDPSWKDRVLNAKVPETEIGFKTHGDWAVVGYDDKPTNNNCGKFKWFLVCLRLLLHNLVTLDGHDYRGKGYGKRVWWHCNKPSCPVCFRKGWAVRLALKMEHRLVVGLLRLQSLVA
jgi:hypothetical protein